MSRNVRGGKGYKKMKKPTTDNDAPKARIILAEEAQMYGMVTKRLGGKRIELLCSDAVTRRAVIPGKMVRKIWLNPNDVVLCSLGSLGNPNECYVEHKYNLYDIAKLKKFHNVHFTEDIQIHEECTFSAPTEDNTIDKQYSNSIYKDIYDEMDALSCGYSDEGEENI